MWRRVLYGICTVEAALLAVVLYLLVIDYGYPLSSGTRQLYAVAVLVLAGGCGYALVRHKPGQSLLALAHSR